MIEKFAKWLYKFMCKHTIGVVRFLYAMPFVAVVSNETIYKLIILMCLAISLTFQIGNAGKWDRE